nr:unnamed protein product [Digitaria exilis]
MLFRHPCRESHSSTTRATTERPVRALVMRIGLWHRRPPAYHPVDNATTISPSSWNLPSHSDGPPPSSPLRNPFTVITARVPPPPPWGDEQRWSSLWRSNEPASRHGSGSCPWWCRRAMARDETCRRKTSTARNAGLLDIAIDLWVSSSRLNRRVRAAGEGKGHDALSNTYPRWKNYKVGRQLR